jgi:hypothetical protein
MKIGKMAKSIVGGLSAGLAALVTASYSCSMAALMAATSAAGSTASREWAAASGRVWGFRAAWSAFRLGGATGPG